MLNDSSVDGRLRDSFWETLKLFWTEKHIQEWRNAIFSDKDNPNKGTETCHNFICLSPDAHTFWTKACFALKPIHLSDDKKQLDLELHWLPKYDPSEKDILTSPQSSEFSRDRSGSKLYHFPTDQMIGSGRTISLTTDDPVTRPLPHPALLEMQWILHRVAAMKAAAEVYDDSENGEDDDGMALENEWDSREAGWGSYEDEWDSHEE